MKAKITIEIDLSSPSAYPDALRHSLNSMISEVENCVDNIASDPDNRIVYNAWEDPHVVDISRSVKSTVD